MIILIQIKKIKLKIVLIAKEKLNLENHQSNFRETDNHYSNNNKLKKNDKFSYYINWKSSNRFRN